MDLFRAPAYFYNKKIEGSGEKKKRVYRTNYGSCYGFILTILLLSIVSFYIHYVFEIFQNGSLNKFTSYSDINQKADSKVSLGKNMKDYKLALKVKRRENVYFENDKKLKIRKYSWDTTGPIDMDILH